MDLNFTDEQDALRQNIRAICVKHAAIESVRALEDDPVGYSAGYWSALVGSGTTGLMIPEQYGGSAMTMTDAVVVYEELGRAIAPSPHWVSCVLGAGLLLEAGSARQRDELLPAIAEGGSVLSVAWLEPDGGFGPAGVRMRAARDAGGWVLDGVKRHVPFATAADHLIVLARVDDGPDGIGLFLVRSDAPGLRREQQRSMASDTQYKVTFDAVRVADEDVLGEAGNGWTAFDAVMYDAIILLAAQAIGGAIRSHELGVEYAKVRHQFDRPLGAFQSIAHYLADRSAEIDGGQVLVWEAAWNRDMGRSTARLAPMAKLFACQAFRAASDTTLHIFGGNGFTVDYDIQLYFRRAKQLEMSFWDSRHLERLIADATLDREPAPVA